jgi:hypothetical protein
MLDGKMTAGSRRYSFFGTLKLGVNWATSLTFKKKKKKKEAKEGG